MFKNLKKKIEQGVAQSKAAVSGLAAAAKGDEKNTSTESIGKPIAESTPQKDGYISGNFNGSSANVPTGQLVDIPLFEGTDTTYYETASDMSSVRGDETPKGGRSRTSSISSMTSDNSFFSNVSFSHSYYVPSDVESEVEETSVNLSAVSKEDLYAFVKRFERRAFKYKSKFMELATAYKDMLQEREKLKSTMAQCQDRAFRRMSELREQIQLDQLAKRDLEDNYRLLLDEKDEYMKVLNMQLKLLKEGKDIPEELQTQLSISQAKAEAPPPTSGTDNKGKISQNEEIELLKSKIRRQDGLLQKCKETITSYKEKVTQLSHDKQDLLGKLELSSKGGSQVSAQQSSEQVTKLQNQIKEAKKVIEQLESDREVAIAGVKQQVHEEMEKRDAELEHVKAINQKFVAENNSLKLELEKMANQIEDLSTANKEQLDKAREIMKRLKEDKMHALEQAEERIRQAEQSMEEEKEKMLSDLKRGKSEAFSVLQQESEKALSEKLAAALEERDKMWNEKMAAQEEAHNEILQSKERDKEFALTTMQSDIRLKLQEKEEEVRLALEERELQKMAAVTGLDDQKDELLRQIEQLNSEKIELSNRLAKFKEDTEQQILELQAKLLAQQEEHQKQTEKLKTRHQEVLDQEKSKLAQEFKDEVDALQQRHGEELQSLRDKLEQSLQESTNENKSFFKSQMESVKAELEQVISEVRRQLEESKSSLTLTQAKLSETEQQLGEVQSELASKAKEYEVQVEELYAAINGKGNENENLKTELQSLRSQVDTKQQEFSELSQRLSQVTGENARLKEQVESNQGEASSKMNELFAEREELIHKLEYLSVKELELTDKAKSLEDINTDLTNQCQILSHELNNLSEELTGAHNQLRTLQAERSRVEVEYQQKLSMAEEEKNNVSSDALLEKEERIRQLEEERECLGKNVENSRLKVEELDKYINRYMEEKGHEKEVLESRAKEAELQVSQLQEIIRSLENCQSAVEREKAHLEEKLTNLEEIVEDLKKSKEELNEKLHERHESLIEQTSAEKQALEAVACDLASQVNTYKEEITDLTKALLSKDDEIIALRSVMDDNSNYIKSIENKITDMGLEIQSKSQAVADVEEKLTVNLGKFEKLKTEANAKVKGLKEMKDSLSEQLELKQKELDELVRATSAERESLVNDYEDRLGVIRDEMKTLELSFKEQFEQKQSKYKETLHKLKEHYEGKLKEKDIQFEERLRELTSQKDLGIEDMNTNFERLKQEQLAELEQRHQAAIAELIVDWEAKCQALGSEHQKVIDDMQVKLTDAESTISELYSCKEELSNTQVRFDDLKLQCDELSERLKEVQENLTKQREECEISRVQLAEKESQITQLIENQNSEALTKDGLINSLTQQLQEKDSKLEAMAGTISAEHEYLQKELNRQTELSEELVNQNMVLSKQLQEFTEKHEAEVQEKDIILLDSQQKLSRLEIEHASMEEMLRAINDAVQERDSSLRSLELVIKEKEAQTEILGLELEKRDNIICTLQVQLATLTSEKEKIVVELNQNNSKELEDLKTSYGSQVALMSSRESELQTKTQFLEQQVLEYSEKLKNAEDRLEEGQRQLERQEASLREQISVLKQQLHQVQSEVEFSSNELQSSLQQRVTESEQRLVTQMESHQAELESCRQEAEQKMKDLKQKYVVKLKEIQGQAKSTIEELEGCLKLEKTAKDEINSELTRANTRLLQLEENSGLSHDTIVDLECRVAELSAALEHKNSEMNEKENSWQKMMEETQSSYEKLNGSLIKAEALLGQKEAELEILGSQLRELNSLLEDRNSVLSNFEKDLKEMNEVQQSEKEKHEFEVQEKDRKCSKLEFELTVKNQLLSELEIKVLEANTKCSDLESLLDKTNKVLENEQLKHVELEVKVQSASQVSLQLGELQLEKQNLEIKISDLMLQNEELKKKLDEADLNLNSVRVQINSKDSEVKSLELMQQTYELKLTQLKDEHAAEISELSVKMESQSSAKVAEYKKKAESYISQVKKQLQDEKASVTSQQQEVISKLEATITSLNSEVTELKQLKENLVLNHDQELASVKRQFEELIQTKDIQVNDCIQKEKESHLNQEKLMEKITSLETEISNHLEKISILERRKEDLSSEASHEIESLRAKNESLEQEFQALKTDRDEKLAALESIWLEKMKEIEKVHQAVLDNQASEHASKLKQLVKELSQQMAEKEREFEATFHEAIDKSTRGEQGMLREHQDDMDELRKELLERDERIQELHEEYKAKLQTLEEAYMLKVKELETVLSSVKQENQQVIVDMENKLKSEHLKSLQAKETSYQEEVNALTREWNIERKMGMQHWQVEQRPEMFEEIVLQNQAALTAFQKGTSGDTTYLQQQVIHLSQQLEQLKQKHKLELAEAYSGVEMGQGSLPQPLVAAPVQQSRDMSQQDLSIELQDLELHNIDLQAQVSHLNGELSQHKIKERELLKKLDKLERLSKGITDDDDPPLSLDSSYINHDESALFREPTEFEYLKNILYEYMMGKETKTLTKVIATVVRFSEEQTKNVLSKAESKLKWLPSSS